MARESVSQTLSAVGLTLLRLHGADAASFLQGYLTADLDNLSETEALPMAYCTIKGRVLANGWVAGTPERVDVYLHQDVAEAFAKDIGKYLAFAKSKFETANDSFEVSTSSAAGLGLPPLGWRLQVASGTASKLPDWRQLLLQHRVVLVDAESTEKYLPQMLGLTAFGSVSFAKGCYLGQEVVARAEHRGEVKRKLRRYRISGETPPVGAQVCTNDDKSVGTVVAASDAGVLAVTSSDASVVQSVNCELHLE